MTNEYIRSTLSFLADGKYKSFMSKLLPTVDQEKLIGVRVPALRKLAKDVYKSEEAGVFLNSLPHEFYEEDFLHILLINEIKRFDICLDRTNAFLPYIDNWAVCDSLRPTCFKAHKKQLLEEISKWITSEQPYTLRFAVEMLMVHYLDDDFHPEAIQAVAKIRSNDYYVNMMVAWYFATALAKQYDATIEYLEKRRLSPWIHNKAIQKAVESRRITQTQKKYLKEMKIKEAK